MGRVCGEAAIRRAGCDSLASPDLWGAGASNRLGLPDNRDSLARAGIRYYLAMSSFTVEIEREEDGRWIGEVAELPGALVYGSTRQEALAKAKALAFRVLADRLEHGEAVPEVAGVFSIAE